MNQKPLILPVNGQSPQWGSDCWIAPNATIVGDVVLGNRCTVWFQAVIRGDVHHIRIGDEVNIQDGAIIHATYQKAATEVGHRVSIGHRALIHGCTIEDEVLIGMGAIVMDHAVVPSGCIIGAGALVSEGKILEKNTLYAGIPARPIRKVSTEERERLISGTADRYPMYADWFPKP